MIKFVRIATVPDYPHSQCFAEIAEAFASALGATVVTDKQDSPALVFGAHLIPYLHPDNRLRKDDVIYQAEVVFPDNTWFRPDYIRLLRSHEVWDYSPRNIEALDKLDIKARLVPIRYMPCMDKHLPVVEQDIDVLFYGSMNARRAQIITDLLNDGIEVYRVYSLYDKQRDELIARAKIVLNIHQHEAAIFEIFRCAHLFANSKCVVSEYGNDGDLEVLYEHCAIFCDTTMLSKQLQTLLGSNPRQIETEEETAFDEFKKITISDELRQIGAI